MPAVAHDIGGTTSSRAFGQAAPAGFERVLQGSGIPGQEVRRRHPEMRISNRNRARSLGSPVESASARAVVSVCPSQIRLHQSPVDRVVSPRLILEAPVSRRGLDRERPVPTRASSAPRRPARRPTPGVWRAVRQSARTASSTPNPPGASAPCTASATRSSAIARPPQPCDRLRSYDRLEELGLQTIGGPTIYPDGG